MVFNDPSEVSGLFEASVLKSGFMYNTQRYIFEALKIEELNNDPHTRVLNSKSEWGHNPVRRLRTS